MVPSQASISTQFMCISNSCSETDHKIPVDKLRAAPIFINSDITDSQTFLLNSGKKNNFSSKKIFPRNFSISREDLLLQIGTCALSGKDITKMHFPTVAAHCPCSSLSSVSSAAHFAHRVQDTS